AKNPSTLASASCHKSSAVPRSRSWPLSEGNHDQRSGFVLRILLRQRSAHRRSLCQTEKDRFGVRENVLSLARPAANHFFDRERAFFHGIPFPLRLFPDHAVSFFVFRRRRGKGWSGVIDRSRRAPPRHT